MAPAAPNGERQATLHETDGSTPLEACENRNSPCSSIDLELESGITKEPSSQQAVMQAPVAEAPAAAVDEPGREDLLERRARRRASRRRLAVILAGIVTVAIAVELWIMSLATVPLYIDKIYFGIALIFQFLMLLAAFPLPESGICGLEGATLTSLQSKLLDVAHWAFVVMTFGGVILLRAPESLLFEAGLAGLSLVFRLSMRNSCIITSVAARSSLPNISGRRVTTIFLSLFLASVFRLVLQVFYGRGFPWDQLIGAITGHTLS
mmetsp:Transcript_96413/g.171390  ORF Transcript_96413/g.171390 Transcript_96413/m.171390 type:complete len:265 (-) Transcript_96413:77-871(-)|eukprot:CAMPEP_0197658746 /NCGR_PEP_ID=MMETSP1338-20131121/45416_1 /TAXON_ID=43686 ORGANISM="Pelagodinium beii, Strain RCC1491" /NCGR_SAMPLE_ID=MMETSP1338 /ASSEMBLY_ACC=CAM_ASM_000754 /LENGTH=264 /DNA_ID=CAMNT_0043235383 /DNA_START=19 /DNA_END=813 /DNA_ORIENTATION=-